MNTLINSTKCKLFFVALVLVLTGACFKDKEKEQLDKNTEIVPIVVSQAPSEGAGFNPAISNGIEFHSAASERQADMERYAPRVEINVYTSSDYSGSEVYCSNCR